MTSDHDLLGMLRGARKRVRRDRDCDDNVRDQNWRAFSEALARCVARGLIEEWYCPVPGEPIQRRISILSSPGLEWSVYARGRLCP